MRVAFTPEDYTTIPTHNKAFAAVAANKILADGSPGSEIDASFEVRDRDILVRKTRFGAFSTTDLYTHLHGAGIDTLVVSGISTSGVVLSSLRDAADADYRLYVLSDATADPDPEVHRVLTEKVFPRQADVIQTDDLSALGKSSQARPGRGLTLGLPAQQLPAAWMPGDHCGRCVRDEDEHYAAGPGSALFADTRCASA